MERSRRQMKTAAAVLGALLVLCVSVLTGAAASVDLSRHGSIQFRVLSGYETIPGGNLLLTQVATLHADGYAWTPALAGLSLSPNQAFTYDDAAVVLQAAKAAGLPAKERTIDSEGSAAFRDLAPGLYLFYQSVAPAGFEPLAPFVVSLPMQEDGVWVYDVHISPKPLVVPTTAVTTGTTAPISDTTGTTTTTAPTPGTTGTTSTTAPTPGTQPSEPPPTSVPSTRDTPTTTPDKTTTRPDYSQTEPPTTVLQEDKLPHTGQLKWPVAALAIAGGLLIVSGLLVRMAGKRDEA